MAFEGFTRTHVAAEGIRINLVYGGTGPPLLLLHGYPQTHFMWHKIAPGLAEHFTVVCPDLRGYGDSAKPPGDPEHLAYAKRTMAADQLVVMRSLGFERFAVAGHDRGARVAYRMALDAAECVSHLAVLDIVPTSIIYATLTQTRATDVWRYFFLTQPPDLPERLIGASAAYYLQWTLQHWCLTAQALTALALAEYERCFDAATIHATCEDYRAGATIDLAHDAADAGRTLTCPTLVLWSEPGLGRRYDVLRIWQNVARAVTGHGLDCGHFLAEERPDDTAMALLAFLRQG
jgi:haloacetate dehalogenase